MQLRVVNSKEIQGMIKGLGKDIDKELDDIIEDIANDVKDEAKKRVPVDKGKLKRAIKTKKDKKHEYKVIADTPYAAAVEHGTRRRTIRAKKARVLATKEPSTKFKVNSRGYTVFGRFVQHPGTKAQPFMSPALKLAEKGAGKKVKDELQKIINKRVARTKGV